MDILTVQIDEEHAGQRVDNFLLAKFRRLPKSRLYRALRKGEVRINGGRIKADYRLKIGDCVRLPPLSQPQKAEVAASPPQSLLSMVKSHVIYQNNDFLVLNKPSGIAVHGGSKVKFGIVELLRASYVQQNFLELVHRLDRDTSGCLLFAKKRQALIALHELFVQRTINKSYLALVKGRWPAKVGKVVMPLVKSRLQGGERMVCASGQGKPAETLFRVIKFFADASLLEVQPLTGRTHQIRVHAAHMGHPIAGDAKYGDKQFNKAMREQGLDRLFLHAASLSFKLPGDKCSFAICALMDAELTRLLHKISV